METPAGSLHPSRVDKGCTAPLVSLRFYPTFRLHHDAPRRQGVTTSTLPPRSLRSIPNACWALTKMIQCLS